MKCSDIQFELPLYCDIDNTATTEFPGVSEHLDHCPGCRQRLSEYRAVQAGLVRLSRPAMSALELKRLRQAVLSDSGKEHRSTGPSIYRWLELQLIPYGIGAVASLIIGFGFLALMFSGLFQPDRSQGTRPDSRSAIMLANSFNPYSVAGPDDISPNEFARDRLGFAGESPSVNPQGALIALTKSVVRGEMRDEEVVIVADVFGNGLARIAEVVEPSDDARIVQELRKALDTDPAHAPFLPLSVEQRPESVRVVFMLQSVKVSTRDRRGRARL